MDLTNPVVQLCIASTRAEFEKRIDDARALVQQAWEKSTNDFEACVAAHYVARYQARSEDALRWNLESLKRADAVGDERVKEFYPSLYLNLGHAHEMLGNQSESKKYYDLAAKLGIVHQVE
ncbi:MAG: hypothetical protein HZC40_20460 [Chloroflexi bacterium]|nr:hypothetical protein [Chloroflexota bacterium]